jgi:hypothetical protein
MEYILHIPQCVARFPFIPRGRRLHIGSIRARAGCPCLAPAIDGSWRSLGTVRTLCRQWVLDTRLAYGLPLCPGSNGRPRCFSAVLSADRSRLASSSPSGGERRTDAGELIEPLACLVRTVPGPDGPSRLPKLRHRLGLAKSVGSAMGEVPTTFPQIARIIRAAFRLGVCQSHTRR